MKKLFTGLFLFLLAAPGRTQQLQYGSKIGISAGWQKLRFLDEHASPLVYKTGPAPFFGVHYTHNNPHSFFRIGAAGGMGTADPERFGARNYQIRWSDTSGFQYHISSPFIHASLQATYLRKLNPSPTGPFSYWLGGTVSDQARYAGEVANMPWLVNTAEISPSFQVDYQPGLRHLFSVKMDFAAAALVSRTVYGLFAKSDKDNNAVSFLKKGTRFTSLNEYQKVHLELAYACQISNRVGLGATSVLQWMHDRYPASLKSLDSRFTLNLNYTLHH